MEAYRYKDEKSDKFWRIECSETAFAVNYGKTGTIGQYQYKGFGSEAECQKEAKKLIASKVKKGYKPYPEFDPAAQFYFDDDEIGLHPLTSHPAFRAHFTDELYYDCVDDEAPFGSDEGADTLAFITDVIRKNKALNFASFPKKLVEDYWDMKYIPAENISQEAVEQLVKEDEMNMTQSDMVTYASAFAQIKITGRLDSTLKEAALNSIRRIEITAKIMGWNKTGQPSEIAEKMIRDLERFPAS